MNASFAKRLRSGQQQLATIISLPCPEIAEIAAASGYDWLFIDAEHGPLSVRDVQAILQAAGQCPCIVRIPTADPVWIAKALDVGAAGILVPQVSTPEQVRGIVEAAKYPPDGSRGVGVARAQGYGAKLMEYLHEANRQTLVFIQAEHQDAVDNIDAIAQVPGLDGILVGPFDLSASLGVTGEVDHPRVQKAISKILQGCQTAGITPAIFAATPEQANIYAKDGFSMIAITTDTLALINSMRGSLDVFQNNTAK